MSDISDIFRTTKRMNFSSEINPAVLIIDMQESFLDRIEKGERKRLIRNQIILLNYCKKKDIPVAAIEYRDEGRTYKSVLNKIRKLPRYDWVVKPLDNGFTQTHLYDVLCDDWKVSHIIFAGIYASGCVRTTALSAIKKGFHIILAENLIADDMDWSDGKSRNWYQDNGKFYSTLNQMLKSGLF